MVNFQLILLVVLVARCAFYVEGLPDSTYLFTDQESNEFKQQQAKFLESVDEILEQGSCDDFKEAQRLLLKRLNEIGENCSLLWRLAKCFYTIKDENCSADKMTLINEGLNYAKKALRSNGQDANAHKWFAIMTADKGNIMGTKERIQGGFIFKKHIEKAIEIKPDDPELHFLNGFFLFEFGKLSWIERTLAKTIFGTLPKSTIDEALKAFLTAGTLKEKPWKMKCVWLARCYLQQRNQTEAKKWLDSAAKIEVKTNEDRKAEAEIAELRKSLKR